MSMQRDVDKEGDVGYVNGDRSIVHGKGGIQNSIANRRCQYINIQKKKVFAQKPKNGLRVR